MTHQVFLGNRQPARDDTDTRVILNLDIPIYSGGLTSSTVRQKLSEKDQAKALLEQEKRRTIGLARSAYLSLEADIANVKARKQAVISTQTSLDATLAGYDAGTRTSVDVLLSQRQLFSSQAGLLGSTIYLPDESADIKTGCRNSYPSRCRCN